jgi:hypothetical protein
VLTRAAPQPASGGGAAPSPGGDGDDSFGGDFDVSSDEEEEGFVALEQLRGAASPKVRVLVGSLSFGAFVSYLVNSQPDDTNKAMIVAYAAVLWDMTMKNPLRWAVGAQAAMRGAHDGAWAFGAVPSRADLAATLAVVLVTGGFGVGKTSSLECVRRRRAHQRAQR